jgi:acetyl esterase/lipase
LQSSVYNTFQCIKFVMGELGGMPEAFLVVSIIGLLFTINAFRPVRIESIGVVSFFAGWLTSELPMHHLAWQVVATACFVAGGALDETPGIIGLAITLVSWCGLIVLVVQATRTGAIVEAALRETLGDDYRAELEPGLCNDDDPVVEWKRLVLPFRHSDPEVEKIADIDYGGAALKRQRLDVYRGRPSAMGRPVFLYIHGGAWIIGDKKEQGFPLMLQLAAQGWVCVTANYALSPKATFPDHLLDVKRALAWVKLHIAEYGGDPGYIVISGGSAGGHLCSLAALTPNRPEYQPGFESVDTTVQGCVPFYGVYDFTNRNGVRGRGMGKFLEKRVMKSTLATARDEWEAASPMDQVNQGAPPFFVVHGANDTLVPVAEARSFVKLLRAASGTPVAYAELPGAQHAFELFRSVRTLHVVRGVERWLAWAYGTRAGASDRRVIKA